MILGHELRLITSDLFYGFTRGQPGNYIGETSNALLIWDPHESSVDRDTRGGQRAPLVGGDFSLAAP